MASQPRRIGIESLTDVMSTEETAQPRQISDTQHLDREGICYDIVGAHTRGDESCEPLQLSRRVALSDGKQRHTKRDLRMLECERR